MSPRRRESAPTSVVIAFAISALGAAAYAVAYSFDLGTPVLGACFGGSFAALAFGLARWAKLIDVQEPEYVEERDLQPSPPKKFASFEKALTDQPVPRTKVLWGMLTFAVASIGASTLFPLRSMFVREGVSPDAALSTTDWEPGKPLVTEEGVRIKPEDLDFGSVLTAFPEGSGLTNVNAVTLLIRVHEQSLQLPPERREWVVDGVVGYSKLCTHAGCPVGLYADEYAQLMCPCHHSIFDVLQGAEPVSGPAPRALPQLPLGVDEEGYLVARGDFDLPPGPGYWGYYK